MAEPALDGGARRARREIIPEEWTKTYDHFLENIQDWCISRQLWWGHQIPAWHGPNGEITVARERPPECTDATAGRRTPTCSTRGSRARSGRSRRSAGPNETAALAKFYPASDLETGYDILFFWVARMMMFGLHFMREVPFRRVLLHGLVVDETGDKMSKVKGNVIDPLDLIHGATFDRGGEEDAARRARGRGAREVQEGLSVGRARWATGFPAFGADALRFTLATYSPQQQAHRARAQAHRGLPPLLQQDLERDALRARATSTGDATRHGDAAGAEGAAFNRWILSRLAHADRTSRTRASTSSASTTPRTRSTASSGTTSATGTSSSPSPSPRSRTRRSARPSARRSRTCSGRACACCTRSCRSSPRSSGRSCMIIREKLASIALEPYPTDANGRDLEAESRVKTLMDVIVGGAHDPQRSTASVREADPARHSRRATTFVKRARRRDQAAREQRADAFEAPGGDRAEGLHDERRPVAHRRDRSARRASRASSTRRTRRRASSARSRSARKISPPSRRSCRRRTSSTKRRRRSSKRPTHRRRRWKKRSCV